MYNCTVLHNLRTRLDKMLQKIEKIMKKHKKMPFKIKWKNEMSSCNHGIKGVFVGIPLSLTTASTVVNCGI